VPASDKVIGRSLELLGAWEEPAAALLAGFLRPGDVAVDVGANVGAHALRFATAVGPRGAVVAIEAQPFLAALLAANAALNRRLVPPGVLRPVNAAASAQRAGADISRAAGAAGAGAVEFLRVPRLDYDAEQNFGLFSASAAVPVNGFAAPPAVEGNGDGSDGDAVPVLTLDAILAGLGLVPPAAACPALIKVDVEGGEEDALAGASVTLAACGAVTVVYAENHALPAVPRGLARHCPPRSHAAFHHAFVLDGVEERTRAGSFVRSKNWLCVPRGVAAAHGDHLGALLRSGSLVKVD